MKTWLKGGLIGLVISYIIYIIIYFYMGLKLVTIPIDKPNLLRSIPSFNWFIIYSLIFFIIGSVIGLIIQKVKK